MIRDDMNSGVLGNRDDMNRGIFGNRDDMNRGIFGNRTSNQTFLQPSLASLHT